LIHNDIIPSALDFLRKKKSLLCLFIAVGIFESFRLIIANSAGLISLKNTTFQFTLSPLEIQTFSKYTPFEPVMQLYNSRPEDTVLTFIQIIALNLSSFLAITEPISSAVDNIAQFLVPTHF